MSISQQSTPQKPKLGDRILLATSKLNKCEIMKQQETARKYEQMQMQCNELENELQDFKAEMNGKLFGVANCISKIEKEAEFDYRSIGASLKRHIIQKKSRAVEMIDTLNWTQGHSNTKIYQFIDQECQGLRSQLQALIQQRQTEGESIRASHNASLAQVDSQHRQCSENSQGTLQSLQSTFTSKSQQLEQQLTSIMANSSDSQTQLYTVLRNQVKQFKTAIQQHQQHRRQIQQDVLSIIESISERAMQPH